MLHVFKDLSEVNHKKAARLFKINSNSQLEEKEEPNLTDFEMTEQTILRGFKLVFGVECQIFARLIYVKCAGLKDFAKLNMMNLYEQFMGLLVSLLCSKAIQGRKQRDQESSRLQVPG